MERNDRFSRQDGTDARGTKQDRIRSDRLIYYPPQSREETLEVPYTRRYKPVDGEDPPYDSSISNLLFDLTKDQNTPNRAHR